jgi:hypothetical protein
MEKNKMNLLSEKQLKELTDDNFKSLPQIMQVDGFLNLLCQIGHTKVTPQEISQIFKDAKMRSLQYQKKIRCGSFKVKEHFKAMSTQAPSQTFTVCIKKLADDQYEISQKNL